MCCYGSLDSEEEAEAEFFFWKSTFVFQPLNYCFLTHGNFAESLLIEIFEKRADLSEKCTFNLNSLKKKIKTK